MKHFTADNLERVGEHELLSTVEDLRQVKGCKNPQAFYFMIAKFKSEAR